MKRSGFILSGLVLGLASLVSADDWPQWRGPQRNGISKETGLLKEWPKQGPPLRWGIGQIGSGYAAPAVVGDRIYILGSEGMDAEFVQAISTREGKRIWRTVLGKVGPNPERMNYAGARSTPTVEGEVLFALGSNGDLACVETATGKIRWQKNFARDFGGQPGDWAYSESPLVDGELVICTPGGAEATMVALNKRTGETIWKCATPEADKAAFASPIAVEVGGIKQYVQLLQKGLVGVEATTGRLLWRYAKPVSRFNANIPTPLAQGKFIYVGSAGTGGGTVELKVKDGQVTAEEVYFGAKFPTAIGGVISVGEFLYGTTAQTMMCIELSSGLIKWEERSLGASSMCYADGRFYAHAETGEVVLVEPSPEGYRERGRLTPPDPPNRAGAMEKPWAYPVIANGQLYIRDHDKLWSYDVRASR